MTLLHIEILEHEHFTYEGHGEKRKKILRWNGKSLVWDKIFSNLLLKVSTSQYLVSIVMSIVPMYYIKTIAFIAGKKKSSNPKKNYSFFHWNKA